MLSCEFWCPGMLHCTVIAYKRRIAVCGASHPHLVSLKTALTVIWISAAALFLLSLRDFSNFDFINADSIDWEWDDELDDELLLSPPTFLTTVLSVLGINALSVLAWLVIDKSDSLTDFGRKIQPNALLITVVAILAIELILLKMSNVFVFLCATSTPSSMLSVWSDSSEIFLFLEELPSLFSSAVFLSSRYLEETIWRKG